MIFRPLPPSITRPLSVLILLAWAGTMAILVKRSYVEASSGNLATDLARYGSDAQWRGVFIWWFSMRMGVRALERMGHDPD